MSNRAVQVRVRIQAPVELVWSVTQDPARRCEWDVRVVRSELLTPAPMGKGARIRHHYRLLGLPSWVDLEYVTWQPLRRAAVRMAAASRGGLVARFGGSWRYDSHLDGSTTWTTRFTVRARGGPLAPWLERALLRWVAQPVTAESARRLRGLVEAEHAAHHGGAASEMRQPGSPNR